MKDYLFHYNIFKKGFEEVMPELEFLRDVV